MPGELGTQILWVLAAESAPVRVARLRSLLPGSPSPQEVVTRLGVLKRDGFVSRNIVGAWTLTDSGRAMVNGRQVPLGHAPETGVPDVPAEVAGAAGGLPPITDPGPPPVAPPGQRVADESQDLVVQAGPEDRLFVEAGPGFGKTDVACARVAWLIEEEGLEPESILLLSFTRTAVREMRARIGQLVTSGAPVGGVEIRTLDSFSWRLRVGSTEVVGASTHRLDYDQSIAALVEMLEEPSDDVLDYIHHFDHVFVDEAQDLTADRARLVARLLNLLRDDAGYTVFFDPAQAIYGWEDEDPGDPGWDFQDLLEALEPAPEVLRLSRLHRTRDPGLRRLLLAARKLVLDDTEAARHHRLRSALGERADVPRKALGYCIDDVRPLIEGREDTFLLFRTRAEALDASSWLAGKHGVAHRLRFGALPRVAAGWLSVVINGLWVRNRRAIVYREEFEAVWHSCGSSWLCRGWTRDSAWRTLRRMGAVRGQRQALDLNRVADRLAMQQLPDELFLKDIGPGGPVVGTVHGSKGREARTVVMTLRDDEPETADRALFEARVLYVALSRAKEHLHVAQVKHPYWRYLDSKRVWSYKTGRQGRMALRIEVGREGDVDHRHAPVALDSQGFSRSQAWLAGFEGQIRDLVGVAEADDDWRWYMRDPEGVGPDGPLVLCVLSREFGYQMWDAIRIVEASTRHRRRPGGDLKHVRWFDVTTVAVSRDYTPPPGLPEPWRSSRVWLSPVVSGLGRVPLRRRWK